MARIPFLLATCVVATGHTSGPAAADRHASSPFHPSRRMRTPAAFLGTFSAKKSIPSRRSRRSTAIPALPNQFGNERLSSARTSTSARKNDLHRMRSSISPGISCVGCRSARTKLWAKLTLEEDTDATIANRENLASGSTNIVDEETNSNGDTNGSSKTPNVDTAIMAAMEDTDQPIPKEFLPMLALIVVVTFLSALDRVAMSIAILPMSSEFGLTETVKGQISSAVSYGYGAAIVPVGLAVSVVSPRLLMVVGVFLWSLATLGTPWMAEFCNSGAASGMAGGTTMLLLPLLSIRAVMGAAEAVVLPTMQRILANWIPPEKKATSLAIVISGFQLGTVGAYLVSPQILDFMSGLDGGPADVPGWRGMFYLYGLAGLLWMVPWWIIAKDAPTAIEVGAFEDDCEETLVNNGIEDDASLVLNECEIEFEVNADSAGASRIRQAQAVLQSAPWMDFVKSPGVWGMTLAHAAKNWELYNLLAWTPTFFNEQYGLNVKESAAFSVLPSICGMIGGLTAGSVADYVLSNFVDECSIDDEEDCSLEKRTQVRKIFQSIALLGPATSLYLLSSLPEQASTAQLLLGGAVGLQAFDAAGFGAATQEKAGEKWAGLLYSLTSLPGVMVGSISVSVTGQILDMMVGDEGAGWTAVFQLNAAVCVAGALAFLLLYDSKKEFD